MGCGEVRWGEGGPMVGQGEVEWGGMEWGGGVRVGLWLVRVGCGWVGGWGVSGLGSGLGWVLPPLF